MHACCIGLYEVTVVCRVYFRVVQPPGAWHVARGV